MANAVLQCPTMLSILARCCSISCYECVIQLCGSGYTRRIGYYLSNSRMFNHVLYSKLGDMHDFKTSKLLKRTCKPEDPPGLWNWGLSPVTRHINKHKSRGHVD